MAAKQRPRRRAWDLGTKLRLWLAEQQISAAAFARRIGLSQSTVQSYVGGGVTPGSEKLGLIARETGLPAEYWLAEDVPYPPPADYLYAVESLEDVLRSMTTEELARWVEILSDPAKRDRALALWNASQR